MTNPTTQPLPPLPTPCRVLLLCGGMSAEHTVSLASARAVLATMQRDPTLVVTLAVLAPEGGVWLEPHASRYLAGTTPTEAAQAICMLPHDGDIVFPLLHGPFGEDGKLQGMLELLGLPYVGSRLLASALCMDKLMMKHLLGAHGIPQVAYQHVLHHEWQQQPEQVRARLQAALQLPVFVKPANMGSSLGISQVQHWQDLTPALDDAMRYDRRCIVEQGLTRPRELEVAVLGNHAPQASVVGEIRHQATMYDFESKYGAGKATLHIPADIPTELAQRCQQLALRAYQLLDCAGLARVDFFVDAQGALWLNELNTMPGFTETSMYPKLWQASGLPYGTLIRRLLALGFAMSQD